MRNHSPEYVAYLKSKAWQFVRTRTILNAGGMCQRCFVRPDDPVFGRPLEVHHKTYETLGHEREQDVQALCHPCHEEADKERADETTLRSYRALQDARFDGWCRKVFGDDERAWPDDADERFERWLEMKERL